VGWFSGRDQTDEIWNQCRCIDSTAEATAVSQSQKDWAVRFLGATGGEIAGGESIFDCARRETMEETGLSVELDRIIYIVEYAEPGYHFCKFFIRCKRFDGTLTLANREQGETFLTDARFFSKADMEELDVRPTILKDRFWDDLEAGFPETRYLGLEEIKTR
jgi:8-oxo-dGTP pyrophosphatase MutT (NUDIX family)